MKPKTVTLKLSSWQILTLKTVLKMRIETLEEQNEWAPINLDIEIKELQEIYEKIQF
jgi:hypothetical protein